MQSGPDPALDGGEPAVAPAAGVPDDGTLSSWLADVRALATEGKTLAQTELAYQTSRAKFAATGFGTAAAFAAAGLVVAIFAVFALIFGLLLSLATLVGPLAATGIVVGALLVVAFILVNLALGRWRRTRELVVEKDKAP